MESLSSETIKIFVAIRFKFHNSYLHRWYHYLRPGFRKVHLLSYVQCWCFYLFLPAKWHRVRMGPKVVGPGLQDLRTSLHLLDQHVPSLKLAVKPVLRIGCAHLSFAHFMLSRRSIYNPVHAAEEKLILKFYMRKFYLLAQ